jgi:serine/threonine protein kinase
MRPMSEGREPSVEIRTNTTELTPELSSALTMLGDEHEPRAIEGPPDALVGTTLSGNYKVLRVIGEGGMGRVYEAQHTRIAGKRFAIKLLHPEYARQPGVLARFQREAEASAAISHPNVMGVYDVDRTPEGSPFMVSELLEGHDFSKQLEKEPRITHAQAVNIARQVCRALQAAHDKGVIHRDVKPENVFITGPVDQPTVKVLDFGISRLEGDGSSSLTKTGMVIGTPAYMPPEQAAGKTIDGRVDVYGVGAILYRALTGRLPYGDDEPTVTIAKLLTSEPERPRQIAPDIPESLEMIIQKAMAREPDRRFQTLRELEQALEAFESNQKQQQPAKSGLTRVTSTSSDEEIAAARPQFFLEIATAVVVAFLSLLGLLDGVIRLARGLGLSKLEFALALLALLGLFGTPLGLLVRHIKKTIWPDTNRVVELSQRFRTPLLISLAVVGSFSIFVHVFEGIAGAGTGAGRALWEVLVPVVAVTSVVVTLRWSKIAPKLTFSRPGVVGTHALGGALAAQFVLVLALVLTQREPGKEKDTSKATTDSALANSPSTATPPGSVDAPKSGNGLPLSSPEAKAAWRKLDEVMRKRLAKESVEAFEQLLNVDPLAPQDKEVRQAALRLTADVALLRNDTTERMNTLLSTRMGSIGIDLMFELIQTRGGTVAAQDADRLLRDEAVRARGTEAMRIAYDLRYASGCDAKKALFDRAKTSGDGRAALELKLLKECRRGNTCCMRGDQPLDDLITAIEKKGEN